MAHSFGDEREQRPAGAEWPRLQLPTFSMRSQAQQPPQAAPQPAPTHPQAHHQPPAAPQQRLSPYSQLAGPPPAQQPSHGAHHAPPAQAPPPGLQPAHLVYGQAMAQPASTVRPRTAPTLAPRPAAGSAPRPTYALAGAAAGPSATRVLPGMSDDGLLGGRITPLQLGIVLSLVAFAFIVARGGPASMNVETPAALPAAATIGGGPATDGGTATLPLKGKPQGMPSPAAAQAVQAERAAKKAKRAGKAVPPTTDTLPLRADDGMTLPMGSGDRDSHASESHYKDTLPMEEPVAVPAITPGQAAAQAEVAAIDVTPTTPPTGVPGEPNVAF